MWKLFKEYSKDHGKAAAAFAVILGAVTFLFYLYGLPWSVLAYTGAVAAVLLFMVAVLPDFLRYRRRTRELEAVKAEELASLELLEVSGPLPERQLAVLTGELCGRIRALEAEHSRRYDDMLNYYTLWGHQIKTPLSAMRLILRSAQGEGISGPKCETLLQELFKTERYVDMVLSYLRLESMNTDLQLEQYDLHELVTQAVKKFAPQFIYQQLSLELGDFHNRIVTDKKWLLLVLEQLLSNALKYTVQGSVSIQVEEPDVLVIRDTGAGISPEDLPRVFERGFTGCNGRGLQEERSGVTSTGLGLYLTKQVLDRLQNGIEIRSQLGKGTEVRVYLHRDAAVIY